MSRGEEEEQLWVYSHATVKWKFPQRKSAGKQKAFVSLPPRSREMSHLDLRRAPPAAKLLPLRPFGSGDEGAVSG